MTDPDTELADAFEEAATTAERVHEERDGDTLSEDAEETLRDPTERLADAVSEASLTKLLDVAGFEDRPEDVSAVDLSAVIRDADADAIVELRTLLQLADLGESWSDLSAEERAERVDRVAGDGETADEGGFGLKEYLDRLGHLAGEDETDEEDAASASDSSDAEAETDADADADESSDAKEAVEAVTDAAAEAVSGGDGNEDDGESDTDGDADADDDSDGDDELLELEEHVDRLRKLVGEDAGSEAEANAETDADTEAAEADAEAARADAAEDAEEEDGDEPTRNRGKSSSGSRSRFSTVPSSRSDMGKSGRFSTARGKR